MSPFSAPTRDLCPGLGIDDGHGSSVSMFGSCANEAVQDAISTCRQAVTFKGCTNRFATQYCLVT
jgi:hypothetical protein